MPPNSTPAGDELETYLEANREKFRAPAQVAFEQIYLNPDRRGDSVLADANEILELLRTGDAQDVSEMGDPTMLPSRMPLAPFDQVERNFGGEFVSELSSTSVGEWSGPIRSTFGLHLVKIDERIEVRDPPLSEVIAAVKREWEAERRREIADERYDEMRQRYSVVLETPKFEGDSPAAASPLPTGEDQSM